MHLTNEQIESNKGEFISLLKSIDREGAFIDKLVDKLCSSDFFYAPASTKYHCNYAGGLCEHSLNVYKNLVQLVRDKKDTLLDSSSYTEDTLKIVALLHDISKMNLYVRTSKNEKVYREDGDKYDALGKFTWETTLGWKINEKAFVFGSHEMTSEFMVTHYIPLTLDESVAILHHMGGQGWDSAQDDIGKVFSEYPLALLLHIADMLATYIDEREVD